MESIQPAAGTVKAAPSSGVTVGGQGQLRSTSQPLPSAPDRDWSWKPDIGDVTLAFRSLAISFGVIFGAFLLFVPGAAVLAAAAFWRPGLVFTWQVSMAISLGISVVLLFALMILSALIGGRAFTFFMLLAVAALVTLGVVHHRDPALVNGLWNHLTR